MWTDTDVRHGPRLLEALRTAPGDLTSSQIQLLMEEGRRQRAWFGRALGRLLGRGRRRDTMPGEVAAAARS
jgi:hypothetical protein